MYCNVNKEKGRESWEKSSSCSGLVTADENNDLSYGDLILDPHVGHFCLGMSYNQERIFFPYIVKSFFSENWSQTVQFSLLHDTIIIIQSLMRIFT